MSNHVFKIMSIIFRNSSYDISPSPFASNSLITDSQVSFELFPITKKFLSSSIDSFPLPSLSKIENLLMANTNLRQLAGFQIEFFGILALLGLAVLVSTSHDFWLKFLAAKQSQV